MLTRQSRHVSGCVLIRSRSAGNIQLKLGDAFAVRDFSVAGAGSIPGEATGVTAGILRWAGMTAPDSTNPWRAFCIKSTALANPSTEKISRCRNTDLGALLASRSVGERLTRSTRT